MRDRPLFTQGWGARTTWWIIGVNVALWFVFAIAWNRTTGGFGAFIYEYLALHPHDVVGRLRVWQLFTALWLHEPGHGGHVLFNMLFLFFFGREVESALGARRYLALYLLAGIASTVAFTAYALLAAERMAGIGASGAVYGVGAFLALREPNLPIYFFFVRMPMWVFVGVFMVGRQVMDLAAGGGAVGSIVAHLAGAAWGFVHHRWIAPPAGVRVRRRKPEARLRATAPPGGAGGPQPPDVRARVDALLEKIAREGIGALSAAEKDFLEDASRRYR
jgi:membrane associated rhomboid family serine protease